MPLDFRVGDVRERLAEIPDGSIDLVTTSPPFLRLRSYLPDDHPYKDLEIGDETNPIEFVATLLEITAELGRVLAPHGTIAVELGDTYAGSGGAGGDYNAGGLRDGQAKFSGSARKRDRTDDRRRAERPGRYDVDGWPLNKCMALIPELYAIGLAYGVHPLTGEPSPAGRWRVRNRIVWARPNPAPGALGDKFRPAVSYITVATRSARRYFDLDAVRRPNPRGEERHRVGKRASETRRGGGGDIARGAEHRIEQHPAGAPPFDWHSDLPDDGDDWLWRLLDPDNLDDIVDGAQFWQMSTSRYAGAHFATYPLELPLRIVKAMCPQRVCTVCGRPSTRIAHTTNAVGKATGRRAHRKVGLNGRARTDAIDIHDAPEHAERVTIGWSDCGHDSWRTGNVLDPFVGSGTTLEAALVVGRDAIGIDLDQTNAELALERVGMYLRVLDPAPRRVQLLRTAGYRKPADTVVVSRPSRFGNPFKGTDRAALVARFRQMLADPAERTRLGYPTDDEIRAAIAGRDVACWCPADEPCHGDVLLEIASRRTDDGPPRLFDVEATA